MEKIVASVTGKAKKEQRSKMNLLAELLDSMWEKQHQNEMEALIYDSNNEEYLEAKTASSFSKFLVHQPWLPPKFKADSLECDSQALFVGSKLFYEDSEDVRNLLHIHVPYIDASLKSSEFRKHLKIQDSVSKKDLLEHLITWSTDSQDDEDETFCTSLQHMSSVYEFLLGQKYRQQHVSDHESESIREAFTQDEVPLIFVPKAYSKDSSKDTDVDGEFLSIHSVCWMDLTTVLYNFQKYNWKIPKNFPRVLSLHYDDNPVFQSVFKSINVRNTPTITSLISLLKFISSIYPQPDEDTMRNFTSIMFYLVDACREEHLRETYLRENLKNSKVFPSSKQVWVSPDETCLLENDDGTMAKFFVDHNEVHFLQWPSRFSNKKAAKHTTQLDKEKKLSFLKSVQISSLSQKVKLKIDYEMLSFDVYSIKERLGLYVPLIQKFLIHDCPKQYQLLEENHIESSLRELSVCAAKELNILYYIEVDDGDPIMSNKPKKEACALDYNSDKPFIYIAEKKKDKPPTYLHSPVFELFMSNYADAEEKDAFLGFLDKLFRSLPSSSQEVEEFADDEELSELDEGMQAWAIPLPIKALKPKKKPVEEELVVEELPTLVPSAMATFVSDSTDEEPKALTCWPPKAAVDPAASAGNKFQSRTTNMVGSSKLNPEDVIGNDELKEVLKGYVEEEESEDAQAGGHQGKLDNHKGLSLNQGKSGEERNQGRNEERNQGRAQQNGVHYTPSQGNNTSQGISEITHDGNISRSDSQFSSGNKDGAGRGGPASNATFEDRGKPSSQKRLFSELSSSDNKLSPPWQASASPRKDMDGLNRVTLLDIQDYANKVDQQSNFPPVIEIMEQDKNEESLLKISRWGEEYVYSVLSARKELPSGHKIESLKWVNREEESGKPYDIEVEVLAEAAEAAQEDETTDEEPMEMESRPVTKTVYIEVKSTASKEKSMFEISMNEIRLAQQKNDFYHVYIVYSAGLQSSRLCLLQNLHLYLRQNSGKLMFVI